MASDGSQLLQMTELSLSNGATKQYFVMMVPEKVYKRCLDDTSGVFASLLFQKIEQMFTVNSLPKEKTLDYTESLTVLKDMQLLDDVIKSAKQAGHVTIGVKTKFDSISCTAYGKEITEETLQTFLEMAPPDLSAKQRVRFMEILAASMPEGQTEGRSSPAASQESQVSQDQASQVWDSQASQVHDSQASIVQDSQVQDSQVQASQLQASLVETRAPLSCETEDLHGQGRVMWTHEAIMLLIDRRRELGHLFNNNAVTQRQAWRKVAEELKSKGYKYNDNDCSKKFRSLRARYKTVKERNKQTGNSRQSWRYFAVMEEMFAGDPAVLPTVVASSMHIETESSESPADTSAITEIDTENDPPPYIHTTGTKKTS